MSTESNSTTLPRRVLGRRLRQLRDKTKMSRTRAAHECEMGSQTLWRLESGRSSEVRKMVINALCDLYGASREERRILIWLAKECRKDGWWQSFTDAMVPEVEMFVGLEQSSRRIFSWQTMTLPGLVQTSGYRRAMWAASGPHRQHVDIERELALIAKRQERLDDTENFTMVALLCESVLHHRIGDAEVMKGQLKRLLELARLPNVSIRVVRFDASNHLGLMTKDFVFLEFPEHPNPTLNEPPVVYVEGYTGDLYLDKKGEIEQYRAACDDIQRVALSEDDTCRLIEALLKEYDE
ncbi:helix-turn-helix domain-containing protein [Nocardia terpenica]|uniref:Helix-turn-helix domain-containing protein n=1 Tax=Nocardia terpenica TaxID=455432 RepID=A0A6G9ZC79_9NOCA|nr:helix-turn-helix transcriptional regulator [Nocardia terpenica]QIS22613.1 helix-turn-helix domain-containing protein [Nocardia terpenica]